MNGYIILIILLTLALIIGVYFAVKTIYYICLIVLVLTLAHYIYTKFFRKQENFTTRFEPIHKYTFRFANDAANIAAHPEIYCGTDLLLPEEYDNMGTRNGCLKKGIGIGMGMSDGQIAAALNRAANQPPPDPANRTYCGNENAVPAGYVGFATRNECLRKGVGVGMRQPADRRHAFQNQPRIPLSKKELTVLSKRFGLNPNNITRQQARAQIANLM
jgi:hypothetical protein